MEARVAKLEATIEHMRSDVSDLKSDARDLRDRMRAVEVKIDHLPSKGFIVIALLASLTAIGALVGYTEQIQSLLPGASP
jgi:phage shock protein A